MKQISPAHCIRKIKICRDTNGAIYQGMEGFLGPEPCRCKARAWGGAELAPGFHGHKAASCAGVYILT